MCTHDQPAEQVMGEGYGEKAGIGLISPFGPGVWTLSDKMVFYHPDL